MWVRVSFDKKSMDPRFAPFNEVLRAVSILCERNEEQQ
jgi:hypothetical protein